MAITSDSQRILQLLFLDIPLGGDRANDVHPDEVSSNDPVKDVRAFMRKNTSAKIVVVIDTHCLDNGAFVYTGNSPDTYQGCLLPEVSAFDSRCVRSQLDNNVVAEGLHSKRGI